MVFQSAAKLTPPVRGRDNDVVMTTTGHKNHKGDEIKYLLFHIGHFIMKDAGIRIGDTVDFLFDLDSGEGIIRRSDTGKIVRKAAKNKTGRGSVRFRVWDGIPCPKRHSVLTGVDVSKDLEIWFDLPELETDDVHNKPEKEEEKD